MECLHPIQGWVSKEKNTSGKRSIVFKKELGFADLKVEVPCGKCINCRLNRAQAWAVRMTHEAQMHEENCFLTLTYADKYLPKDYCVSVKEMQKFIRRLKRKVKKPIRYFYVGEYGESNFRPHYHLIVFGYDFPDKVHWKSDMGNRIYISEMLDKLWKKGFSTIGNVTFDSAGYVARYAVKKVLGKDSEDYYKGMTPEFCNMSKRPKGIGQEWFEKYHRDVFPHDYVVLNGRKIKVPKYYDKLAGIMFPEEFRKVKARRNTAMSKEKIRERKEGKKGPHPLHKKNVREKIATHLKRKV